MGSPRQTDLIRVISLLYEMNSFDRDEIEKEINKVRTEAWRDAIATEARKFGVTRRPPPPSGSDLRSLKALSKRDAKSILKTYNRELGNEIQRLFNANPRGNRNYYISNLETWANNRDSWKSRQIALNSEQTSATLAQERFYQVNNFIDGLWIYEGPAPVSDTCKERFSWQAVTKDVVDNNPTPAHLNCPHKWNLINSQIAQGNNPQDIWLG